MNVAFKILQEVKRMSEPIPELEERVEYRIEGEFCANCSAKMERTLSSTEGMGESTINYATKTVFLLPSRIAQAQDIMERIEAGVKLVPIRSKQQVGTLDNTDAVYKENQWRLARIMTACALFAGVLFFEWRWKNSSWVVLESLVYFSAYFIVGYKVLAKAVRNIFRGQIFDENFLMSLATVGAIAINALPEACLLYTSDAADEEDSVDLGGR